MTGIRHSDALSACLCYVQIQQATFVREAVEAHLKHNDIVISSTLEPE